MAHSNATAVLTFQMEGVGTQDINDESWAMDNLGVTVTDLLPLVITQIQNLNTNVMISWLAVPQTTYRVQYKLELAEASWNDLQPTVTALSSQGSFTERLGAGHRFYRVGVVP